MGEEGWERARVLAGRPAPGAELTEAHTPLEAGLGGAVSLDKGCYIGQEVGLARRSLEFSGFPALRAENVGRLAVAVAGRAHPAGGC